MLTTLIWIRYKKTSEKYCHTHKMNRKYYYYLGYNQNDQSHKFRIHNNNKCYKHQKYTNGVTFV